MLIFQVKGFEGEIFVYTWFYCMLFSECLCNVSNISISNK